MKMDKIALFNNWNEYKKDLKFLEDILLISTDSDVDDIDEIYDFSSRETFPYSVYNYNQVDIDINSYLQKHKTLEDILKKNCVVSMLYTLLYLRDSGQYSSLSRAVSKYIGGNLLTVEYNHIYDLFDRTVEECYLNDFALIKMEEIDKIKKGKKEKEKKRLICHFCEEFTLHIIANNRNNRKNNEIENTEKNLEKLWHCSIYKFPLDHYLNELKDICHYQEPKNDRDCYLKITENYRSNLEKLQNMKNENLPNKIEYVKTSAKRQYSKNKKAKTNVWNIFSGLEMVEMEWKSQERDDIKRLLYEYKKEMVFHSNAFLTRFAKIQQKNNNELYCYDDDPYYYIDELTEVLKIPIAYGAEEIYTEIRGILHETAFSFQYVSIPILEKTFFAVLFKKYNENIDTCIQRISEYILDHYSKHQEREACRDKIDDGFIDSDICIHLAPELVKAFSSQYKFVLLNEYKQNDKLFSKIRNEKKREIAMSYFRYTTEHLGDLFSYIPDKC